jgi:hypothetical protein
MEALATVALLHMATAPRFANGKAVDEYYQVECNTYRHCGDSRIDLTKHRDPDEVEAWLKRDPMVLYRAELLIKAGLLTEAEAQQVIDDDSGDPDVVLFGAMAAVIGCLLLCRDSGSVAAR